MTDLTKITTPFGLLDPETQAALNSHWGPYEFWNGIGWSTALNPNWEKSFVYRVKPIALTHDTIDWSHVAEGWNWMARDEDGLAYMYDKKPSILAVDWVAFGQYADATLFTSYRRGTVDWKDSLVRRPK